MATPDIYARLLGMGMAKGYASQIANGKRSPSESLALRIYRETGLKIGPIANFSRKDIEAAERLSVKRVASQQ